MDELGEDLTDTNDSRLYINIFVTTCAEFPGILLAASLIGTIGRRYSQLAQFAGCGIFILLLVVTVFTAQLIVCLDGTRHGFDIHSHLCIHGENVHYGCFLYNLRLYS